MEVLHDRHRKEYDGVPTRLNNGYCIPRGAVPSIPNWLREYKQVEPRVREEARQLCKTRPQCELFRPEHSCELKDAGTLRPAPEEWLKQNTPVLSDEALEEAEQVLYLVREAMWKVAHAMRIEEVQEARTVVAKFHVTTSLINEILRGPRDGTDVGAALTK